MATGENIRKLRQLCGLTLEQLSELSGVEVGTISALEIRDSARSKFFPSIAKAFGISTDELSSDISFEQISRAQIMYNQSKGDSPADWMTTKELAQCVFDFGVKTERLANRLSPLSDTQASSFGAQSEPSNLEQAPSLRGKVPLISFVQAGEFAEVIDNFQPGDGEDWIDVTCQINRHTFALRVVGDSMEPDFPAGTIIVVEPDMQAEPGDYVVAKNGDDATFKQLIRDNGDWYLKPINPRYPIKLLGETRIIGVVREAVRKFR